MYVTSSDNDEENITKKIDGTEYAIHINMMIHQ